MLRGSPRLPSIDSKIAVSSPQMYAPGALADLDVEGEALAEDVVAEVAARAGLVERRLERVLRLRVLAPDVDEAELAAGRVRRDRHRLDQGERIALHDHAVLERARLRLVGVADEVVRACGLAGDRIPLDAGREGGAAATLELRVLDLADDALRAELEGTSQARRSRPGRGTRRGSPAALTRHAARAAATDRRPAAARSRAQGRDRRPRARRAPRSRSSTRACARAARHPHR